jgi:hypothetical protein
VISWRKTKSNWNSQEQTDSQKKISLIELILNMCITFLTSQRFLLRISRKGVVLPISSWLYFRLPPKE